MISFDVVSLFTSIPLDTARLITEKLLTNNTSWQTKTELNIQDILDLLDLCLSTEFCFQNNYYRQISDTPMGLPLSSFLAEAVMQDLESKAVFKKVLCQRCENVQTLYQSLKKAWFVLLKMIYDRSHLRLFLAKCLKVLFVIGSGTTSYPLLILTSMDAWKIRQQLMLL